MYAYWSRDAQHLFFRKGSRNICSTTFCVHHILCMIIQIKCFSCYILLTVQISCLIAVTFQGIVQYMYFSSFTTFLLYRLGFTSLLNSYRIGLVSIWNEYFDTIFITHINGYLSQRGHLDLSVSASQHRHQHRHRHSNINIVF